MLEMQTFGDDATRPPILIVHGLYGSGRNWGGVIARRLADDRRVITVDMRNHGGASRWEESHDYHALAADLADVVDAIGGQADLIGHSMGGKAAMVLALDSAERVRRLLVADIAPVAYSHTQVHLIHAMRALDLTQITTRSGANAALEAAIPPEPMCAPSCCSRWM